MNIKGNVMHFVLLKTEIYPKIEEFVQFIHFLAKLRYLNSFASILLQRSYMGKSHFSLNKRYANEIDHNSASNRSFGKIFSPT